MFLNTEKIFAVFQARKLFIINRQLGGTFTLVAHNLKTNVLNPF